jgi:hypothetical protein
MNARTDIEDAARALGVELLPWQREIGQKILDGERIMVLRGRRAGWTTLARVIDRAATKENGNEA